MADVVVRGKGGIASLRAGLVEAGRRMRLVMLVWALFLVLAWVAALPAWRWWDGAFSRAPEADRLLDGLNLALLSELTHGDRRLPGIALASAWTFLLFALIANPFVAGATIGVLRSPEHPGRVTHHFVERGMHFYWRFARVLLMAGIGGALVATSLVTMVSAIADAFDARGWERASLWVGDLALLIGLAVFGASSLVIDLSRVHIARAEDLGADTRSRVNVREALRFVRRNVGAMLALSATVLLLLGAALVIYFVAASQVVPRSWFLVLLLIAWQQAFSLVRTALRIAMLAAQVRLVDARSALRAPSPSDRPVLETIADPPIHDLPSLG
jgi:hypothetical protein